MPFEPQLQRILLTQIRPDPTQTRTEFDADYLRELADSIQEVGLVQPISVREVKSEERRATGKAGSLLAPHTSLFELISGEGRFRATQLLNKEDIAALVYPESTPSLETEYIALAENIQREDLSPIDEAKGYFALTQPPYDQTNRQIAKKMGKPEDYVSRSLALLELAPEVQESLERSKLSPFHARFLAKIANVERQIVLARQAISEGWSSREMEKRVKEELSRTVETADANPKPKPLVTSILDEPDILPALAVLNVLTPDLDSQDSYAIRYAGKRKFVIELILEPGKDLLKKVQRWAHSVAQELSKTPPTRLPVDTSNPTPQQMKDWSPPKTALDSLASIPEAAAFIKKWKGKYGR